MTSARPPLPLRNANSLLENAVLPTVKYQILTCQGSDILVGRLKVETPTPVGHAFILRRFDTDAISLTTMFRAAFPSAGEEAEKREVQWVKDTYDLTGNNGTSKDLAITRLAGTWVSPSIAVEISEAYQLRDLIRVVVEAKPDPKATYRRSGKKEAPPPVPLASAARTLPSPTSPTSEKPAKRRKESSPAPPAAPPAVTPRRSTRTKSPKPMTAPMPSFTSVTRSAKKSSRREETDLTVKSDETVVVDEEGDALAQSVGNELHAQDIAEQRDMIAELKAQRDKAAALAAATAADEEDGDQDMADEPPVNLKRLREDESKPLEFDFKEPQVGERAIATNRRITPKQKSLVWGMVAFAVGASVVSFLPNLF